MAHIYSWENGLNMSHFRIRWHRSCLIVCTFPFDFGCLEMTHYTEITEKKKYTSLQRKKNS